MPSKGIEVKLKRGGMGKLLKSDEVREGLTTRAQRVLDKAYNDAPVDTGDYRDSLHIEQATTDRAVVRVVADDWKSAILEAEHGILSRALDAADGD